MDATTLAAPLLAVLMHAVAILALLAIAAVAPAQRSAPATDLAKLLRWEEEKGASLALCAGDDVLWRFCYGATTDKPFFHPLAPRNGPVLTTDAPADHRWHHGVWFSWKLIDGVNFWEHDAKTGKPVGRTAWRDVKIERGADFTARIDLALDYLVGDDVRLVEARTITVTPPDDEGAFRIDWSARFTARGEKVVLDRTPLPDEPDGKAHGGYAGLSLRLADLTDRELLGPEGPVEFNAQNRYRGRNAAMELHGRTGDATAGIAVCTDPQNLNAPSPWYSVCARGMTFFTPAVICYGKHEMKRGDTFALRYRVVVHRDAWDVARLNAEQDAFAPGAKADEAGTRKPAARERGKE